MSDASLSPVSIINLHMVPNKMAAPLTAVMNKAPPVWRRKKKKAEEDVMAAKKRPAEAAAAAAVGSSTTMGHNNIAEKETEAVEEEAARNSMTVMSVQALATAEEEVDGPGATLGDMEVALRAIKNPSPVPSPSQHTDMLNGDGSAVSAQGKHSSWKQFVTTIKGGTAVETFSSQSPTTQFEYDIMEATHKTLDFDDLHKSRSFALMDDNESISSEESFLERNDDKSLLSDVASTNTVTKDEEIACVDKVLCTDFVFCRMKCAFPDAVEDVDEFLSSDLYHLVFSDNEEEGKEVEYSCVDKVLESPTMSCGAADFRIAEMDCACPNVVGKREKEAGEEGNQGEGEGVEYSFVDKVLSQMDCVATDFIIAEIKRACRKMVQDASKAEREAENEEVKFQNASYSPGAGLELRNDSVDKVLESPTMSCGAADFRIAKINCACPNAVEEKGKAAGEEGNQGEGDGEGVEYSFVDKVLSQMDCVATDFIVAKIKRSWQGNVEAQSQNVSFSPKQQAGDADVEAQSHNVSYSPGAGLVLRKDGCLPKLSKDEVLIRVNATTISTRDCLERIRRDTNKELKDEAWVPGHEIVGHVVRAGMNAEFLLDQRVAAVLPYGGGCSQYVCISSEDVIALPEEAGSIGIDVVALLSSYMTAYQCLESVVGVEAEESPLIANDAGHEQEGSRLFGKNVLIVGAGGPVGLALVDLARNAGATVYTVSQSSNLSAIVEMGAHYWYGFSQKETWEAKWAGEMDLIVDTIGDPDNNPSFHKVMKTGARLVRANITSCEKKYVSHPETETHQFGSGILDDGGKKSNDKAIDYDVFHSFNEDKELFTKDLASLLDLYKVGKIRPRIVSRVGFDKLEGEWEKVMSGEANGCVLVRP